MAVPGVACTSDRIDLIITYEKQIIAIVGEAHLLELYRISKDTIGNIERAYKQILSEEEAANMVAILGKDCLLSIRLLEFKQFISCKPTNVNVVHCLDQFENESSELLKEAFQAVSKFDFRTAIEFRDFEMVKRFKALKKEGYSGLLRFAEEYARVGTEEEIQKSQAIVEWIESEQPDWK